MDYYKAVVWAVIAAFSVGCWALAILGMIEAFSV